jgi:hypothetical protein
MKPTQIGTDRGKAERASRSAVFRAKLYALPFLSVASQLELSVSKSMCELSSSEERQWLAAKAIAFISRCAISPERKVPRQDPDKVDTLPKESIKRAPYPVKEASVMRV